MAYLILRDKHDRNYGDYKEEQAKLPKFINERESFQEEMKSNWSISIIPM